MNSLCVCILFIPLHHICRKLSKLLKMYNSAKLVFKAFLSILFVAFSILASAQTIRGKVTDAATGEPLVGATVSLENTKFATIVNLDGSYVLKNVPAGRYEIKVKYSGYEKATEKNVEIKAGEDVKGINFQLKTESKELDNVIIRSSKNVETDKAARGIEQKSDIVQNILSQKAIELSPDVTVANSLQRISGISIERSSSGEGRYAIIRGMDQRYNSTLVNGIKIPSPDDKFRYVPMDLFPSDLLERLEVIKSLTPFNGRRCCWRYDEPGNEKCSGQTETEHLCGRWFQYFVQRQAFFNL